MGVVRGGDGSSSEDELRRHAGRMLDMLRDPEVLGQLTDDELAQLVALLRGPYERTRERDGDGDE